MADGVVLQILGGDSVGYSPKAIGASTVNLIGVFEARHQRTDVLDASVTSAVPAVFVRMADLAPNDPETDEEPTVTVSGTTYRVRETRKDGLGGALLLLQAQAS